MSGRNRMGVPPRRRDVYFVESPKANESLCYTVWSVEIYPVYTHWTGTHTVPCYQDHSLCDGGHKLLNMRWKGYLFGYSHERAEPVFAQLTQEAANQLMDQIADGTSLRGLRIRLSRSKKNKGRLSCHLETQYRPQEAFRLPPVVCPRLSLFNLWNLEPNNHPFTQYLDDQDGFGPQIIAVG